MTKKYALIIPLLLFLFMFSGCVNTGYSGRARVPVDSSAQLSVETANVPPPHTYEKKGPPPWAPAHGYRAKYNYRYYPSSEVYFDTHRRLYFCYRNGSWSASASLPGGLSISVNDFVTLEMDTDRPYTHHVDVQKKYPPKKAKKIKKEKVEKKNKNQKKAGTKISMMISTKTEAKTDPGN